MNVVDSMNLTCFLQWFQLFIDTLYLESKNNYTVILLIKSTYYANRLFPMTIRMTDEDHI